VILSERVVPFDLPIGIPPATFGIQLFTRERRATVEGRLAAGNPSAPPATPTCRRLRVNHVSCRLQFVMPPVIDTCQQF
jgi:hypothetical protein